MTKSVKLVENKDFDHKQVLNLYHLNGWSSANKPDLLLKALINSDSLVLAYIDKELVGLGNAISDGFLVVYYPHLLVHPEYKGLGIGRKIMERIQEKYQRFHQQMLIADKNSTGFYIKCGFEKAGKTQSMWIYSGSEH